jgi:hypothetical protein
MPPLSAEGPHSPQKSGERFRHEAKSYGDLFGDLLGPQGGALSAREIEALVEPPGSPRWKVVRGAFLPAAQDPLVAHASRSIPALSQDQVRTLRSVSAFIRCTDPSGPRVCVIAGYAGVGKTTIMGPTTEWCKERILPFAFLAFTNSAVDTARARNPGIFTKDNARTLHSTLYGSPKNGSFSIGAPRRGALDGVRIVFVDEASLVPSAVMRDLLAVANRKGIKVVIFGDPFQLGAVEVNEERPFEPLKSPHVAMRDVVRQGADSGILRLATMIRERGKALAPQEVLPEILPGREEEGAWRFPRTAEGALELFVALWRRNPGGVAAIVRGNKERVALNTAVRERLRPDTQGPLSPDEPLMVLGNTKDLSNGARIKAPAWVRDCEVHALTFKRFDEGSHREVEEPAFVMISHDPDPETNMRRKLVLFPETLAPSIALMPLVLAQRLPESELRTLERWCRDAIPVTPYYVGTCHKAQGKEWEEVVVIPPAADSAIRRDSSALARWAYTAITRAKKRVYCEVPQV